MSWPGHGGMIALQVLGAVVGAFAIYSLALGVRELFRRRGVPVRYRWGAGAFQLDTERTRANRVHRRRIVALCILCTGPYFPATLLPPIAAAPICFAYWVGIVYLLRRVQRKLDEDTAIAETVYRLGRE